MQTRDIGIILLIGLICLMLAPSLMFYNPNDTYGGMYGKADGGFTTIVLTTPDVYVQLKDLTAGHLKDFTFTDSNLIAGKQGHYLANFGSSVFSTTNGEIGVKLFINNTGQNNCYAHRDFIVGKVGYSGFTCIIDLNANDYVNIQFDDHANPTGTLTVESANLTIVRIGD